MGVSPEDTNALLADAHAGSTEALGQALESCRESLRRTAEQKLDDPRLRGKGGASDLVQHTFMEAHRDFSQFRGRTAAELLRWLRRLLLNNLANFRRLYRKSKRRVSREVQLEVGSAVGGAGAISSGAPTPSADAIATEQAEALHRALARLPDEYRRVILLRYEEERSFAEIGQLTGHTENGAQKLWMRATQRMRQELEQNS